jgi:hypothetical protein
MFYDERINAEQGRAYRTAMIFALVLMILYGALHGALLVSNGSMHVALMSVEIFCGIGTAVLIAYGELKYGIRPADEMVDNQKKSYYSRAFFGAFYMLIAVYCCIRVPFSIHLNAYDITPNHLIILLALSTWLVLLFCFKHGEIPLNSSFIEVSRSDYWLRVLKNIGKLGGITAIFTAISAINTFLLTKDAFDFISVLLAGLITFVSFAIEYVIFSYAERSSDKAKENGKISAATLIFVAAAVAVQLLYTLLSTYVVINIGAINSSAAVMRINSLQQSLGYLIFYFFGLFAIYLYSELKALKNKGVQRAATLFLSAHVIIFCIGQLTRVTSSMISGLIEELGTAVLDTYLLICETADTVALAISLIALVIFTKALIELGLTTKKAYVYPATFVILKVTNLILSTQHRLANVNAFIESFGLFLLYAIMLVFLCERRRKADELLSASSNDIE